MPIDTNGTLQFTPVDTGDMSQIPPDLPEGEWDGTVEVKAQRIAQEKGGYLALVLELTVANAYGPGGENYIGSSASEWLIFYPETHKASKMSKVRTIALCESAQIDPPDTSSLVDGSLASLEPFVDALEANQIHFWTTVETNRTTNERRTRVRFSPPGQRLSTAATSTETATDDADTTPPPAPPRTTAPAKAVTNGHGKANGNGAKKARR